MSTRVHDEVDVSSTAFWSQPPEERERSFAVLRRERPVSWHRPAEGGLVPQESVDPGYWAVVRQVARIEERIRVHARSLVGELAPLGEPC